MGRPKGSKNVYGSIKGHHYSAYLSRRAIVLLELEIDEKLKSKDSYVVAVPKRDLKIGKLIAECVDYVIAEGKLQCLPSLKRK